jgi:hypothetical protein
LLEHSAIPRRENIDERKRKKLGRPRLKERSLKTFLLQEAGAREVRRRARTRVRSQQLKQDIILYEEGSS